jgi:hypothetical protein
MRTFDLKGCYLLETKFGIQGLFLWEIPKLFPYPNGNFGGLRIGGK